MAMLMTNEVFARTWGERAGPAPQDEYWPHADRAHEGGAPGLPVHRRGVLGHGVDAAAAGIRPLLRQAPLRPAGPRVRRVGARAPPGRRRLPGASDPVHREPRRAARRGHLRAAPRRGPPRSPCPRLQGARLYHDGQLDGRRTRIPVFLGRGPDEPPDGDLRAFYARLLRAVDDAGLRDGDWRLCDCEGWPDNDSSPPAGLVVLVDPGLTPPRRRQPLRRPGAGARAPAVGRRRGTQLAADRPAGRGALRARRRRARRRGPVRGPRRAGRRTSSRWSATTDRPGIMVAGCRPPSPAPTSSTPPR